MANSFDESLLKKYFLYNYECWVCGKNHNNVFHHICGREEEGNSSILNAAPVANEECHLWIHPVLCMNENKKLLLKKTMKYLLEQGYSFNEVDKKFIEKHSRFYEDILREDTTRRGNET